MSAKHLLLPSAKSAVLVHRSPDRRAHWLRMAAVVVGILCIVVGLADVSSRLARATLGDDAALLAFGPAAAIQTPIATSTKGALIPATLSIPSLGVRAPVEQVGKKADGSMGTPQNFMSAGWYAPGSQPGAAGNAVFAGHVNNALTKAGVFEHLSQIKKGDYVTVADEAGKTLVYKVSDVQLFDPSADTSTIFATSGPQKLVLITCDGEWVQDEHQFSKRLVVFATPAY